MPTNNPISQNNDDYFYTAVCAYVRGEPNGVVPDTVGEEQAEIAKRLLQENPAILDDKDRLLAEIATIHYRESGMEAAEAGYAEMYKKRDDNVKHVERLAAEDRWWLPEEADLEPPSKPPSEPPEGWRVHNGRVNRDCISKAEYDRRMEERRAAGLLLDPSTAQIYWHYARTCDPYCDGLPLLPEEEDLVLREYFARAPGSDIWVSVRDLPDATRDAIWKRFEKR
jgi:hypothetical protein